MRRDHLDAFVQALQEPSLVVSSKGDVFAANRAARDALAITAESFTLMSVVPSADDLAGYLRLCARSSEPLPGMLRVRRGEEDDPVAYSCHAGLLARAEGDFPALVLMRFERRGVNDPFLQLNQTIAQLSEEVRRRRDAEERLRALHEEMKAQSEERFRLLVESVKDYAIFILDPKGYVATWNAGAERIKGYSASEIIGKHFSTFYPAEDVGKCEGELEIAVHQGRFEEEGWRVRKDGTTFWANVTITPLRDHGGTLVGFAKVTRDLTERRKNEEDLRRLAAERAVLAEKARMQEFQERFIAILGHDLRNPLAAIDMAAAILGQRAEKTNDIITTRIVGRMRSSSGRMTRMITQILDLARSRLAGGLEVKPCSLNLCKTLGAIIEEMRTAHPSRQLELRCPETLRGTWDSDRLEQVFSNLVGNALSYGLVDQPVVIEALAQDETFVTVSVHNAGPPIPDALQMELFNPFRRGERDGKMTETAGLGLGLYISREIVVAHGGTIDVRSNSADGTTFLVTLPRAPRTIPSQ